LAFAFHVGLFWREPSKQLSKIARSLRPGGAIYLCANGFSIREVLFEDMRPTPVFSVVAEPA
jgi:hypothetical protein